MRKFTTLLFASFAVVATAITADEYRFIKQIPIGGEGGWDYLSVDAQARRLYVTHASKIVVVDLNTGRIAGEIADTPGVHGFAIAPPLGFSSNGRENKVSIVDLKTLATNSKVGTGENPDAILYEPEHGEVYAFNGRGQSASVIDVKSAKVVATIPLGGKPEFAVADPATGPVFCNIEDKSEVVAIDTKTHKITARWPLAPGEEPSGLAFDPVHHRLFAGCSNKLLVMLDSTGGKVLGTAPIGTGVDACAFDDDTGDVFASCGDGTITIAKVENEKLEVVQKLETERGARTMALDPMTHHIYTATGRFDPEQKDERGRPKIINGTFHLLEYGPKT
jgi:YVTN family beta-propeller protein